MNITAYLHPERLLVATWEHEDSVPVLLGYKQFRADTILSSEALAGNNVHIILHRSHVDLHWFPVDDSENADERRGFESSAWAALQSIDSGVSVTTASSMHRSGCLWLPSVTVNDQARQQLVPLSAINPTFFCDIDLDIQAALATTSTQPEPWLLLGRRGAGWTAVVINEHHQIAAFAEYQHDDDYTVDTMIALICRSMHDRFNVDFARIMLFGDMLTSNHIAELNVSAVVDGYSFNRLQPFRNVRSAIDGSIGERLIRQAHVVSPLVGSMLHQLKAAVHDPS